MSTHERRETFVVDGVARLVARLGAADLTMDTSLDDASETGRVVVTVEASGSRAQESLEAVRIEQDAATIRLDLPRTASFFGGGPRFRVRVSLPAGSAAEIGSGSGDVMARGTFGDVTVRTGSGDVRLEVGRAVELQTGSGDVAVTRAATLTAKAGSGDVRIGRIEADGQITTGSGDVALEAAADLTVTCGSGRIEIGAVQGTSLLRSGSGGVTVRDAGEGNLAVRCGSGSIRIAVAGGVTAHLDVATGSGSVHSSLEPTGPAEPGTPTLFLRARAASGSVHLDRARG